MLHTKLGCGMRVGTVSEMMGCARSTTWRFLNGARIKRGTAAAALAALARQSLSDPEIFPQGIDLLVAECSKAAHPAEVRRTTQRLVGFIAEFAITTGKLRNVQSFVIYTPAGLIGSAGIVVGTPDGPVCIRIHEDQRDKVELVLDSRGTILFSGAADSRNLIRVIKTIHQIQNVQKNKRG